MEYFSGGIAYALIGIHALLPVHFFRASLKETTPFNLRFRDSKVLITSFLIFYALSATFFLVFERILYLKHPEVYAMTLSSLLAFVSVIGVSLSQKIWNKRNAFSMLLLFMALSITLIFSAYLRESIISLAAINILFVAMLAVLIKNQQLNINPAIQEHLDDYNLTKRQRQVAELILSGLSFVQIARRLKIAESTASKHGSDIYAKTGCSDKATFYQKFHETYEASQAIEEESMAEPNIKARTP